MCYTNTAFSIKILAAICFCINTFNLLYIFMRYNGLLPKERENPVKQFEEVMPPVKNLDKYMTPVEGTILVGGLAGISIAFDACLYIGVENERPAYVLAAWVWGILDSSCDFCIGIAAGNMTFMDGLARITEAPTTERPSTRPYPYRPFQKGVQDDEEKSEANQDQAGTNASALIGGARAGAPQKYPHGIEIDKEQDQLTTDKLAVLILYVIFRLAFKIVALAGIRNYVTWMKEAMRKKQLAMEIGEMASPVSVKAIRPPEVFCPDAPPVQFPPPGMIAPWPAGFDQTFGTPPPPGFRPAPSPGFRPAPSPGFKPAPSPGFKLHDGSREKSHPDKRAESAPKPGFKPAPSPGFKPHDRSKDSDSSSSSYPKPGFKAGFFGPPKAGFKVGHRQ